ncbi:cysteine peptidase family C39 domain-containing protein [Endozoicomonas sp.]|uniref:cysteine peptidase family C39 domain-containing protein n=1 Tax=Endozoicomonas sp. TaxID=1892382 RepID=UPI00383ABE94
MGEEFDLRCLEKAAAYCGLDLAKNRRDLIDLSEDDLPCILQLQKKHFMIVTEIRDGECFVSSRKHNIGVWMPIARLVKVYAGVIYQFTDRREKAD